MSKSKTKTFSTEKQKIKKHPTAVVREVEKEQAPTGRTFDTSNQTTAAPVTNRGGTAQSTEPDPTRKWSPQQEAIFQACKSSDMNLQILARAGTGKTTTIIEACRYLNGEGLLCAFNKRIAEELQIRLNGVPDGASVKAMTLHSLGFSYLRMKGITRVDNERADKFIQAAFTRNGVSHNRDLFFALKRLLSLVKECAPLNTQDPGTIEAIDIEYGVSDLLDTKLRERLYEMTPRILEDMAVNDGSCDFSDMLWLPLKLGLVFPRYDFVIVDEAQDMNTAQLELALRAVENHKRIIVVGDDRQSIYSFRGAASDTMTMLATQLKAMVLPLTVTYRCPKKVVELARTLVPDFEAAPSAKDGEVCSANYDKMLSLVSTGDFILSRTNAPLMSACLELIRAGKRARVEGKDIGKGLLGILHKLRPGHVTEVSPLVQEWASRLTSKMDAQRHAARIEQVYDQAQTLEVLAEECETVPQIADKINSIFADNIARAEIITCSTVHKSKGLEAENVFVLEDTFFKGSKNESASRRKEEENIRYVAYTRAIKSLYLVRKSA